MSATTSTTSTTSVLASVRPQNRIGCEINMIDDEGKRIFKTKLVQIFRSNSTVNLYSNFMALKSNIINTNNYNDIINKIDLFTYYAKYQKLNIRMKNIYNYYYNQSIEDNFELFYSDIIVFINNMWFGSHTGTEWFENDEINNITLNNASRHEDKRLFCFISKVIRNYIKNIKEYDENLKENIQNKYVELFYILLDRINQGIYEEFDDIQYFETPLMEVAMFCNYVEGLEDFISRDDFIEKFNEMRDIYDEEDS
jgi:hypothetical protein